MSGPLFTDKSPACFEIVVNLQFLIVNGPAAFRRFEAQLESVIDQALAGGYSVEKTESFFDGTRTYRFDRRPAPPPPAADETRDDDELDLSDWMAETARRHFETGPYSEIFRDLS